MCIINNKNGRLHRAALLLTLAGATALPAAAVKGVIVDQYGQPVPSAQITVKGTSTSVLTDADGVFDLDLSAEKTSVSLLRAIWPRSSMWGLCAVPRIRRM